MTILRRGFSLLLALSFLISFVATADAFTIKGRVVNGTTGETALDLDVVVVNPAAGMTTETRVRAVGGAFTAQDLAAASVYIVRVEYKGVSYNANVQPEGRDTAEVKLEVFEPVTSWEGVSVSAPTFSATRHEDHLVVERMYEVSNRSTPPRTVTGEAGNFRLSLPPDISRLNGVFVSYLGVPIERSPVETEEADVYRVEYPLRPGATRIAVSYTVPYADGHYQLRDKILYDIAEYKVFSADSAMEITSDTHQLAAVEGPHAAAHAAVERSVTGLKKGDVLGLLFQGGSAEAVAEPTVLVVPNPSEKLSLAVMVILLLTLITLVVMTMREHRVTASAPEGLEAHRDVLLRRLAKLDDLFSTGVVSRDAYEAKRLEIKNQAASLTYRMHGEDRPRRRRRRPSEPPNEEAHGAG